MSFSKIAHLLSKVPLVLINFDVPRKDLFLDILNLLFDFLIVGKGDFTDFFVGASVLLTWTWISVSDSESISGSDSASVSASVSPSGSGSESLFFRADSLAAFNSSNFGYCGATADFGIARLFTS